jgi:hypothetical protein
VGHTRKRARTVDVPTQIPPPNNLPESSDESSDNESVDQNFVETQDLTQPRRASPELGEKPTSTPPSGQRVVL